MKKQFLSLVFTLFLCGAFALTSPPPGLDIATLRTQVADNSTIYYLSNEVFLTAQMTFRSQKYIQDATAAILIDDPDGIITNTYNIGDGITGIFGTLVLYDGYLELRPTQNPAAATSTGNIITPVLLTVDEFLNNFENYESELIEIDGLTFDDAGSNFTNGNDYGVQGPSANTMFFRTHFWNVDYIGTVIPSSSKNIVGIAGKRSTPDKGIVKYYIAARDSNDISNMPIIPLNSTGILIAFALITLFVLIRFRSFIF